MVKSGVRPGTANTVRADVIQPNDPEGEKNKVDGYASKAAESLAAASAATNGRDRLFHERAYCIWRKLQRNVAAAEERAALAPLRPTSPPKFGQRR